MSIITNGLNTSNDYLSPGVTSAIANFEPLKRNLTFYEVPTASSKEYISKLLQHDNLGYNLGNKSTINELTSNKPIDTITSNISNNNIPKTNIIDFNSN